MMFTCLQLCYCSAFIANIAFIVFEYDDSKESIQRVGRWAFLIYWMLNVTAHSIFALKYWVLSQKV
jgi:hypothetical protein